MDRRMKKKNYYCGLNKAFHSNSEEDRANKNLKRCDNNNNDKNIHSTANNAVPVIRDRNYLYLIVFSTKLIPL